MQIQTENRNSIFSFRDKISAKFPAFRRVNDTNRKKILRHIALSGETTKYDLHINGEFNTGTASKEVDKLLKSGYLDVSSSRHQMKGPGISKQYSLTWHGLIVSLSFSSIRSEIISVLRKSPLLTFPVKNDTLDFIESIYSKKVIEEISEHFLNGLLDVLPPNAEKISNEAIISFFQHAIFNMNIEKVKALFSKEKSKEEQVKNFIAGSEWIEKIERFQLFMAENIHRQIQALEELQSIITEIKESIA